MPVAGTPLSLLLSRLREWLPIPEFEAAMNAYFSGERSAAQLADYRAKRRDQKKLRDEVAPVLRHLRFTRAQGEVRFQLNDDSPDCWIRDDASAAAQGIEVTVALARAQQALGVELNERGISPGFLDLQDDAPTAAYLARRARGRVMFVADSKLQATGEGIRRCIKKKSNPKYAGFDLLIEAPFDGISEDRWSGLVPEVQAAASGTV